MAELSADAAAIVDRLKREGDLSRNSGTHSIRSVKIELSKFEDIFKSISTNISMQTDVLRTQTELVRSDAKVAEEEAERSRSEDQFEKLEPQNTSREKDNDNDNNSLVTESESKKIDAIGNSIRSALSFKNLALAGAGLFVGYNFLKGFIDEKTGGGFTEFENNIGPFAKKLPIIGAALEDLPATFEKFKKVMLDDFPSALKDVQINIKKMSDTVSEFAKDAREKLEEFATVGGLIKAALSLITPLAIAYYTAKTIANLTERDGPDGPDRRGGGGRGGRIGPLLGNFIKGGLLGAALTYSGNLGPNEEELQADLERRRAMGPTIDNESSSSAPAANTQIIKKSEQSLKPNVANEKVSARPLLTANRLSDKYNLEKQEIAAKKWDVEYGLTHNADGTPKIVISKTSPSNAITAQPQKTNSVGGGRGMINEQPGERSAYLESLQISNNSTRQNGLNTVSGNGSGGGSPVIINAPVNAPSSVNVTNGGSSVSQLSISGGGGAGIGPSMLPYGLTNAYN